MIKKFVIYASVIAGLLCILCSCLSQGVNKISIGYENFEAIRTFKIDKNDYGTIYISGIGEDTGLESSFEVLSLYWFGNWAEGWTEVRFTATGSLSLTLNGKSGTAIVSSPIELVSIEDVKIRYRDTIIEHDNARRQFEGRSDRLQAASDILREHGHLFWKNDAEIKYPSFTLKGKQKDEDFVHAVQNLFFPELYSYIEPYSASGKEALARSGELFWDTGYTKTVFPEHFHEVRNSGTIYRDWVESKRYVYFLYMFEEVFGKEAVGKVLPVEEK